MKKIHLILGAVILLSGCTTVQNVNKLEAGKVNNVCIVEHKEVREEVLTTIEEGLNKHGVKYRVIPGSYVIKDKHWIPTFQTAQAASCDATLFYVANWSWDITMYMHFANIWMTSTDGKTPLGNANYDARASLNKFINAHNKLIELVDAIFDDYRNTNSSFQPGQVGSAPNVPDRVAPAAASPTPVVATVPVAASVVAKTNSASPSTTSQKLRELQDLRKDGVITEDDFQMKKKQLLDQM